MVVTFCVGNLEEHGEKVHEFLLGPFRTTEPICVSLGPPTKEELYDFLGDLRDSGLSSNFTTLAFDGDEHIGISLNTVKEFKFDQDTEPYKFENDYAQAIAEGPYNSRTTNRIVTFIDTLENNMERLLDGPGKILRIDVLGVRSDYQRQGIAQTLVAKAIDTARQAGCQWIGASATAVASQSLFEKLGFQTMRELSFDCFLEDGIPVFRSVPDGGSCGKLMIYTIPKE